MPSSPQGRANTSYQSPPTWPDPGTYRAATSTPATAGSAEGTRLRCRATAAAWSSRDRSDCTASAAAVGGELEQRGIVGSEDPVVYRADVQHPEHRAMDEQRDAHQRPDALCPEGAG